MRLWWEVGARAFRRHATYRAAVVAGVFTNTVFGCVRAYVLLAVFAERAEIGGYDAVDAVTFTFLTQGLIMATGGFQPLELGERIATGDVAVDLHRPVDLQAWWLASDIGRGIYHLLARGAFPVLVGALLFDLRWPAASALPLLPVTLLLGVVVSFALRYLTSIACFWLLDARGVTQVAAVTGWFLSGLFIPLTMFPGSLRAFALAQPWAMTMQVPADVWLGGHTGTGALAAMAAQVAWAVALLGLGWAVTRVAVRKVVIQGG